MYLFTFINPYTGHTFIYVHRNISAYKSSIIVPYVLYFNAFIFLLNAINRIKKCTPDYIKFFVYSVIITLIL